MSTEYRLVIPEGYRSEMDILETEKAIKLLKDGFEEELAQRLSLTRVSAPLFVEPSSGLNDNLNGVERPVCFDLRYDEGHLAEVVHSLAKWKRYALKRYHVPVGQGLYTDMNAIRRDEVTDNLHSLYVDQWDWELVIRREERTEAKLREVVGNIYAAFRAMENVVCEKYPFLSRKLPEKITFITTQELEDRYPDLDAHGRENAAAKEYGAVFLMQIGGALRSGEKHDGRAPDYDDWSTPNSDGFLGLNGDLMLWNHVLDIPFELSSMGIRFDEEALRRQLKLRGCEERLNLSFHRHLLNGDMPYSIGGGIGQSRLCMFLLQKAHIGEVQASIWPEEQIEECAKHNIILM